MESRENQSAVLKSNITSTNANNGYLATTFENYFDGTVGCWCRIDEVPEGAEFIRHSTDRQGNITSSYWKLGDCVVRHSNHWGTVTGRSVAPPRKPRFPAGCGSSITAVSLPQQSSASANSATTFPAPAGSAPTRVRKPPIGSPVFEPIFTAKPIAE